MKTAIIGMGRVGAFADSVATPSGELIIRNHVAAAIASGCELSLLVDRDPSRLREVQTRYGAMPSTVFSTNLDFLNQEKMDLVVLATPPIERLSTLKKIFSTRPAAILLEKPCGANAKEAEDILALSKQLDIPVFVSFNRRLDPGMTKLRNMMPSELPRAVQFRYSKGLKNYGSHIIDHILDWFGPIKSIQADPARENDPDLNSVGFRCVMQCGLLVDVLGVPNSRYDIFEGEVFFNDVVFQFKNNGVEKMYFQTRENLYYPGYVGLDPIPKWQEVRQIGGFQEMYVQLRALTTAGSLDQCSLCYLETAVEGMRAIDAVICSAHAGGTVLMLP